MRHIFNGAVRLLGEYHSPRMAGFRSAIDRAVRPCAKVLELGGGRGVLSFFASRHASKVWCLDAAVSECSGGQEGLNEIERAKAAGMPYSVVLLDNRMPSMDGFEVAQALRTSSSGLNPLVLMLTSDNRRGDLSRCHALGITRYLVKPIKRVQLLTALSECLAEERLSEQHVAHEKETLPADLASRALRILLVDDSPSNRILIQAYLKHSPHRVEVADNGAVAVEMLLSNTYDLVFMDMQMPVMDGYDATAAVRKRELDLGIPPVPIIALTAAAFKEDQERCLKAGCTAYISKPVRKSAVLNAIHTYTR